MKLVPCIALVLCGCGTAPVVQQHGGMREVLREGNTQPRIALTAVTARPGCIAVGALAGLGGEITIVHGNVWVARSRDGEASVSGPAPADGDRATLLTVAHVDEWVAVPIATVCGGADLATVIADAARRNGIDTSKPFPFIVEGELTELDAHVIAGSCPIANPNGDPPWRFSLSAPAEGKLVGFYAEGMDGIMTHHGDATHTHVILDRDGQTMTAHVDRVGVGDHAVVYVPAGF